MPQTYDTPHKQPIALLDCHAKNLSLALFNQRKHKQADDREYLISCTFCDVHKTVANSRLKGE
jgi:hypothetical protein